MMVVVGTLGKILFDYRQLLKTAEDYYARGATRRVTRGRGEGGGAGRALHVYYI
jgi:hypothetical protein